jgi:divalent metal cation (Fe/Co/Zn/Cd) transporter
MVFKNSDISLKEANKISCEVEQSLKKHFKNRTSILIRLDPYNELED